MVFDGIDLLMTCSTDGNRSCFASPPEDVLFILLLSGSEMFDMFDIFDEVDRREDDDGKTSDFLVATTLTIFSSPSPMEDR